MPPAPQCNFTPPASQSKRGPDSFAGGVPREPARGLRPPKKRSSQSASKVGTPRSTRPADARLSATSPSRRQREPRAQGIQSHKFHLNNDLRRTRLDWRLPIVASSTLETIWLTADLTVEDRSKRSRGEDDSALSNFGQFLPYGYRPVPTARASRRYPGFWTRQRMPADRKAVRAPVLRPGGRVPPWGGDRPSPAGSTSTRPRPRTQRRGASTLIL